MWGSAIAGPAVLLYAPPEHAARYLLPLLLPLLTAAALTLRTAPAALAALVVSGQVISVLGYRPVAVHHQAANLQQAARAAEAAGAQRIAVWSDQPDSTFPPAALTALVDYYVSVPVTVGGALSLGEPGTKARWWEVYQPPPWHTDPAPADVALLCLFDTSPARFEAAHPRWQRTGSVSLYRGSSWLLPREVVIYRR